MRVAVLVAVAACSSSSAPRIDSGPDLSVHYTLRVGLDSTRADMPQVFIDGAQTTIVDRVSPPLTAPIEHSIELRYLDQVLARMTTSAGPDACGSTGVSWTSIDEGVSALVSGDLRYGGAELQGVNQADGTTTICNADGFARANCNCQVTERCAPRVTRTQPLFTRMLCTPIGTEAAGDPCTMTDDPAGAYDDCGTNLVCLQGVCASCAGGSAAIDYPPEARCQ